MSSGGKGTSRAMMIPSGVKNTIQNLKEIIGQSHSEEEIYAMLKECSMDPNETAQKLLLLDTFHEVKRRRDRKKENLNKESSESRQKPGVQTRLNRGGWGNYSSRHVSHDAGGGRTSAAAKENATSQISDRGVTPPPLPKPKDAKKKVTTSVARLRTRIANDPTCITSPSTTVVHGAHASAGRGIDQSEVTGNVNLGKSEGPVALSSRVDTNQDSVTALGTRDVCGHQIPRSSNSGISISSAPSSGAYSSSSDPVYLPSQDSYPVSAMCPIKHEVESQHTPVEQIVDNSVESNSASVGPGKEWKPNSTSANISLEPRMVSSFEVHRDPVENHSQLRPIPSVLAPEDETLELQRKLDNSHISDGELVIIPSHLHVPEAEKLGFCFGSFDVSFGLETTSDGHPDSDKNPLNKSSEAIEELVKEQSPSDHNELVAAEDTERLYPDHSLSSSHGPVTFSLSDEVSSSILPEYSEPKQEVAPGSHQQLLAHTSSNYSFGLMAPILSSQLAPLGQQSIDLNSYYPQFYRPGADSDGHSFPLHSAGAVTKCGGDAAVVSVQISPSPQEGGVPLVFSTAAATPISTQASGVMQTSISAPQQPLVLRQPTAVHLPHYHPNYIPYGPYFSPFYVPPPSFHQFLSNGAFAPLPQAGSVYQTPPGAAAKFSVAQYKQEPNTGYYTHVGIPGGHGSNGMPIYATSSTTAAASSTSSENRSQFKENINVSSQQGEGSGVWFTAPSRDMVTLQTSSFYNLPQGQLAFTPTQPGYGGFAGIFHPAQPSIHPLLQQSQAINGSIDTVEPTASVHQQPQAQLQ